MRGLHLGDDPQRSLTADIKLRQVETSGQLRARVPVRTILPSGVTTVKPITASRIVP